VSLAVSAGEPLSVGIGRRSSAPWLSEH